MGKSVHILACIFLGIACWPTMSVDCTMRGPLLQSFLSGVGASAAKSRGHGHGGPPHGHPNKPSSPFRILPTILTIKNGRVRLNYGYNPSLRLRLPPPSSYSLSDWIPLPKKHGPPKLPTFYGPGPKEHHSKPAYAPDHGWQHEKPHPPKGWAPEPPKGWHPEPPKGWAPKKKQVIYVLLKEPNVKTNVQVQEGEKAEPEVILQYEGFNHAQTHYEINKPTPAPAAQAPLLLEQQPVFVPAPSPSPAPSPVPVQFEFPIAPSPQPVAQQGGYAIQNQNLLELPLPQSTAQPQPLAQPVTSTLATLAVNNAAPHGHNIFNGYSGYSLNSLNTNGLPISLVFKRMPELTPAEGTSDNIGHTSERVEVSVSSVTKQVTAS